jgi:hypothetical protein
MTASGAYGDIRVCAGFVGNAGCTIGDAIFNRSSEVDSVTADHICQLNQCAPLEFHCQNLRSTGIRSITTLGTIQHFRVLDERLVVMVQKLDLCAAQLLQFAFNIGGPRVSKQLPAGAY